MDQNLGGGDAIEHLNTVVCGFGCSFGMSQKKGSLTMYFPRGRKGTGIGGRTGQTHVRIPAECRVTSLHCPGPTHPVPGFCRFCWMGFLLAQR